MRSSEFLALLLACTCLFAQNPTSDNTPTKVRPCSGKHPKQSCAVPPSIVSSPGPDFSDEARQKTVEGEVDLEVVVGVDGRAHDVRVTKSLRPGQDEKAVEAVKRWTFKPGTLDGKPVGMKMQVQIDFHITAR